MRLKSLYKAIVPLCVRRFFSVFFYRLHISVWPIKSFFLFRKIAKKEKINIILMMYNVDSWKLHTLYKAFDDNKRFKPIVVVCPIITKGEDFLLEKINASIAFCQEKKYNFFSAYDYDKAKVIDIKKELSCDIVFFTNPNQLSGESLYIDNFDDCLTCYVPYSFRIDRLFEYEYNNRTVNKVWKCFYETEIHKELAEKYADNKGRNVVVSGFPYLDTFRKREVSNVDDKRKLIVWAPHWTITGAQETGLDWSCFLDYCDFVLILAEKYKDKVRFVMKPHPFLFETLRQDKVWGKAKTEDYLKRWNEAENCSVETGDYVPLFFESDALIHDSGSFMTEYLLQNKPMAYTINDIPMKGRFNAWGEVVVACHSILNSIEDFEFFVESVLCEIDNKESLRITVINDNLKRNSDVAIDVVRYLTKKIKYD